MLQVIGQSKFRISRLKKVVKVSAQITIWVLLFIYIIQICIANFISLKYKCYDSKHHQQYELSSQLQVQKITILSTYSNITLRHHQQKVCMWMMQDLKFPLQCCWKFKSSRMSYQADWWIATDVSKRYSTFICRVKQSTNSEPLQMRG
jgi:hypothetical protein